MTLPRITPGSLAVAEYSLRTRYDHALRLLAEAKATRINWAILGFVAGSAVTAVLLVLGGAA